ncbi:MAG: glycosyltransferase [Planctomycetota bacterium]
MSTPRLFNVIQQTQVETSPPPKIETGRRKIIVALPAFNEGLRLGKLLEKISHTFDANRLNYEIIVVDDGSSDDTAEIAQSAGKEIPVTLVKHVQNQGLSGALNTCLRTALNSSTTGDIIITMDADDTHPPKIIDRLVTAIDEGMDVAIASRYQPGSRVVGVPWNRVLLTQVASYMFRTLMPIPGVRDYTCGYRAYKHNILKQAINFYGDQFVSEKGFSCMVDVLLKMRRFEFVMGEVPFILRYDMKEGESKMPVGNTVVKTLKLFAKRRFGGY